MADVEVNDDDKRIAQGVVDAAFEEATEKAALDGPEVDERGREREVIHLDFTPDGERILCDRIAHLLAETRAAGRRAGLEEAKRIYRAWGHNRVNFETYLTCALATPDPRRTATNATRTREETSFMPNRLMQFFTFEHLPEPLRLPSIKCFELASSLDALLPESAEKTAGLRKLLEAKDCFVRAVIEKP